MVERANLNLSSLFILSVQNEKSSSRQSDVRIQIPVHPALPFHHNGIMLKKEMIMVLEVLGCGEVFYFSFLNRIFLLWWR